MATQDIERQEEIEVIEWEAERHDYCAERKPAPNMLRDHKRRAKLLRRAADRLRSAGA